MSMRQAIARFRELHDEFKGGAFKSPDARKFYEGERDDFLRALVQAQQLALRPGQSPRQAVRVGVAVSVVLQIGPRQETGTTMDVGPAGFAAILGAPLAVRIPCEFELAITETPVRGRARVVNAARDGAGSYRTSFSIDTMSENDRSALEIAVIDRALAAFPAR